MEDALVPYMPLYTRLYTLYREEYLPFYQDILQSVAYGS